MAFRAAGNGRHFHAHGGCGGRELAADASFEVQQRIQFVIREERAQEYLRVRAADAVHATVALHQSHGIPRKIVVHDVPALLEIEALGQDISAQQQIELVRVAFRRVGGLGRETPHGIPPRDAPARLVARDGSNAPAEDRQPFVMFQGAVEESLNPINRVRVEREDQHLALLAFVFVGRGFVFRLLGQEHKFLHQRGGAIGPARRGRPSRLCAAPPR